MPAWSEMWSSLKRGEIRDAGNYLFLDSEDVERGKAADAAINELNRRRVEEGVMSREAYTDFLNRMNANAFPTAEMPAGGIFDRGQGPLDGFVEGAGDGLDNIANTINRTVDATVKRTGSFLGRAIPWYIWAILVLVVTFIILDKLNLMPKKA